MRRRFQAGVAAAGAALLALAPLSAPAAAADGWWQGPAPLGGYLTSGPDITSSGPGKVEVFALGGDHGLWYRAFGDYGWEDWHPLGAPPEGPLTGDPTAVSWGYGRIDVFAVAGSTLVHTFNDGFWHPWENWGGNIRGGVDAATSGPGHLDVFARGQDDNLVQMHYYDQTGPGQWYPLGGGVITSDPSAIAPEPGRIEVFAKGLNNEMLQRSYNAATGWTAWRPLPSGIFTSAPDAAYQAGGRMDVFALGLDRGMWQSTYQNGQWSTWTPLGGVYTSDPGAVSWGPGRLDVVGRGQNYSIWQTWNNG